MIKQKQLFYKDLVEFKPLLKNIVIPLPQFTPIKLLSPSQLYSITVNFF